MKTLPIALDLHLSEDALTNLRLEAGGLGITSDQAAGAVLEHVFTKGPFMDDERVLMIVDKMRTLYPAPQRPDLDALAADYKKALEAGRTEAQNRLEITPAGQITMTLPPSLVRFLREVETLFPELWSIFIGECVEAVLDGLEHYIDNAYSFPSPQDRMEAFRQVRQAREVYQQVGKSNRGVNT